MWFMNILYIIFISTIFMVIDLVSFNVEMHRNSDSNQSYEFLKNIYTAVSLLKNNQQTIHDSGNCLAKAKDAEYISAECINYGIYGGFSVKGEYSPLYTGGHWKFSNVGGVIKHVISNHDYYFIFLNKGNKVNHDVFSLIPQNKYKIIGFKINEELVTPSGSSGCQWANEGEIPCKSVPEDIPDGSLLVVL